MRGHARLFVLQLDAGPLTVKLERRGHLLLLELQLRLGLHALGFDLRHSLLFFRRRLVLTPAHVFLIPSLRLVGADLGEIGVGVADAGHLDHLAGRVHDLVDAGDRA